jgi:HK97 family phage portal protein
MSGVAQTLSRLIPSPIRRAVAAQESAKALATRQGSVGTENPLRIAETNPFAWGTQVDAALAEPYSKSLWVYACVSRIARTVTKLPVKIMRRTRGGELVDAPDHEAARLFAKPNIDEWQERFWERTITSMLLFGEAPMAFEPSASGRPAEVFNLVPQWLQLKAGARPDPELGRVWEYGRFDSAKVLFYDRNLARPMFFNPCDPALPFSPLEALRLSLSTDYAAQQTNLALFRNGARPDAILRTEQRLGEEARERLLARWRETFQGPQNAHRMALLSHGLDYQEIQRTMQDMQFLEGRDVTRQEIMAAFGVPPIVLGFTSDGWGESNAIQWRMFIEQAVIPVCAYTDGSLEHRLAQEWPKDPPVIKRDLAAVEPIISRENEIREQCQPDIANGSMTINQYRARQGWEPVAWGDAWWAPFNLVPVSDAAPIELTQPIAATEPVKRFGTPIAVKRSVVAVRYSARKRASLHRLVSALAASSQPQWVDLLRDLGGSATTNADNPIDRKAWRKALTERGSIIVADGMAAAYRREDEFLRALHKAVGKEVRFPLPSDELPSILIDSPYAVELLTTQTQRFATSIPDTVYQALQSTLAEGISAGETEAMLTARVQQAMGDYIKSSAQTIARTEAHGAANGGTYARWNDGGEIGTSTWSSVGDERTRESHLAADGQEVALGEEFDVGGESLKYPGDPSASPDETIGCRCIVIGNLKED